MLVVGCSGSGGLGLGLWTLQVCVGEGVVLVWGCDQGMVGVFVGLRLVNLCEYVPTTGDVV